MYALLLLVEISGLGLTNGVYTLLDQNVFVVAFALSMIGGLLTGLSMPGSSYFTGLLRRVFAVLGLVLSLSPTAFMILNGTLDHYPSVRAETHVVRTYRAGRSHDFHIVVSPSWRKGRNQEDFQPIGDFDGDLQTGDLIRVEVHRGTFLLPWGPSVTNRVRCPERVYGPPLC